MGMSLTMAGDYAIRAMIHLASLPENQSALRSEISRTQRIPLSFMAKILRRLVQARLLRSARGVNGGFALARPPSEITLLDVVEAIEGPITLTQCASEGQACTWSGECPGSLVWPEVQKNMKETLQSMTLECLVGAARRNGRIAFLPGEDDKDEVQAVGGVQ
jgi:Rrf2 family protein